MAVAATAATTAAALGIASPAHASGATRLGCPSGAVCMWSSWNFFGDTQGVISVSNPDHIWYNYGYHTLNNEWGTRLILNNQYATSQGKPAAYACTAARASACGNSGEWYFAMDDYHFVNIDPINYIRLTPSGG